MVRVICGRSDLGQTKNADKRFISKLGWDFRVVLNHSNDINANMLIFIHRLTEITKILDIPDKFLFRNFSGNSGYFGKV